MPQRLRKLLDKNPIIPTATASLLIRHPERVEALYQEIVKTHMSIGETGQYQKRILECLLRNQNTFNGAVVGEYGFGKTSILIFLWAFCIDNKIMAVPPYQWDRIDEHISVIHKWIIYKLRNYDSKLHFDLTGIYDKYKMPTIENEARKWSENHNVDIDTATNIIKAMHESGRLSLELKAEDIINYCDEVTSYLQNNTEYKGLIVFTDELQQTITQLNQRIVYDFLFDITNQLVERRGNFGFLWGFPITTQADLQRNRSDILDRLNSNRFFLKLFNIYDSNFPTVLWGKFCDYLDIRNISDHILDRDVLISIGQICDGDRRDLGNGPRSVISAFNRIAGYFLSTNEIYTLIQFVNDCLDDQIVLGDRSEFKKKLDSILTTPGFDEIDKHTLKLLAAFPNGIPIDVIQKNDLKSKIDDLIQKTGGLGRVIVKEINSYLLKVMRKNPPDIDSVVEDEVRKYFSQFAPDKDHEDRALSVFNEIVEEDIFNREGGDRFETWKLKDKHRDNYFLNNIFNFEGSFTEKFPLRKVRVITRIKGRAVEEKNPPVDIHKEDMSFTFEFSKDKCIEKRVSKLEGQNSFILRLSFHQQPEGINEHKINDIVPLDKQSPLFFLGLIDHLNSAAIPNDEIKIKEHLLSIIKRNIIYNLFNDDLLGDIENSTIDLNNQGEVLVKDLFRSVCENLYSGYVTLMTGSSWEKKLTAYINALKQHNNNIGLMELRGVAPVLLSQDRNDNKARIAKIFNVGTAMFDTFLSDMKAFTRYRNYEFYFQVHPLETQLKDYLDSKGHKVVRDQKDCLSVAFGRTEFDDIRRQGYTDDEINLIIEVMEARQLLSYDNESSCLYKILEDSDQLRSVVKDVYDLALNNFEKLSHISDGLPVSLADFEDIKRKVECIETKEHAGMARSAIKGIMGQLVTFSVNGLKTYQLDLKQIKAQMYEESQVLKSISENDMKDFPSASLPWQNEIYQRRVELTNEVNSMATKAKTFSEKANSLTTQTINDDETAIQNFINIQDKASTLCTDIDIFKANVSSTKDKVKNLVKWKSIIKLCDGLNEKLILYARLFESDSYQIELDTFNAKVLDGLRDNPYITLANHENFKSEISIVQTEVFNFINNLRNEWNAKVEYCRNQVKKITGIDPNWRLRWGDLPSQAYIDLNESLQADLKKFATRLDTQFTQMEDDVLYTKEVLNHAGAIKSKNIQERIQAAKEEVANICLKLDDENLFKSDVIDPITQTLVNINTEFADLNRTHSSIIKPTTIDSDNETRFVELLNKNEGLDLKSLIINYQKACNPDINLTESRDEVLDIIKSLFLKKQVTIQVRRGKV